MDAKTKAVLMGGYWSCLVTLLGAIGLFAAGLSYAGSDMIHTALKVFMLSTIIALVIELNDYLKGK